MKSRSFAIVASLMALIGSLLLVSCAPAVQTTDENKKIAVVFMKNVMEGENAKAVIEQYCAPDIVVEFPASFRLPSDTDNMVTTSDELVKNISAWQREANHKVNIIETIGEGSKVVVLARVDRIFDFNSDNKPDKIYNGHLMAFFFDFNNKKIAKVTAVFDVLQDVEKEKAKKHYN